MPFSSYTAIQYLIITVEQIMSISTEIFQIIKNALPLCSRHQQVCQNYDKQNQVFSCQKCIHPGQSLCVNVNDALLNSTLLMSNFQNQNVAAFLNSQLTKLSKFQINYRKNSQMLTQYFGQIQKQIKKYTKHIENSYKKMEQNFNQCSNLSSQIKEVCSSYNNFLIEQLQSQFQQGTTDELLSIFKKFSTVNQDPFQKLQQKIRKLLIQMQNCSNINWNRLQNIYEKVTDPFLWQISKVIVPYQNYYEEKKQLPDKIFLPNNPATLLGDFQYLIKATQKQIELLKINPIEKSLNDSFQVQNSRQYQSIQYSSQLKSSIQVNNIDMIYQLPERRLLAVSYDKLELYSYKFQQLVKETDINISGCTEVLVFQNALILLASQTIYKISCNPYKNKQNSQKCSSFIEKIEDGYCSICYQNKEDEKSNIFLGINSNQKKKQFRF